jgi:hypothetical protein
MHRVAIIVMIVALVAMAVAITRMFLRGAAGHSTRTSGGILAAILLTAVSAIAAAIVSLLT